MRSGKWTLLRSGIQKRSQKCSFNIVQRFKHYFFALYECSGFHWNGHLDFRDSSDQRFRTYYWNCSADLCYGRLKFCFYHPGLISFSLYNLLIFMWSHKLRTQRELGSKQGAKAMKSSPLLGPFGDSEFWGFSLCCKTIGIPGICWKPG